MTDPTDPSTFTEMDRFYNGGNYADFLQYTVDFSSYIGNGKYIAFRNVATNSDAVSSNYIDDISISENPVVTCEGITVPYEQGFEAQDESIDCWTFLPDVENAAIPQVSTGTANSGTNSIYMAGRGIYALPEITNVDNVSNLVLTFSVKQRKYAHRLAVGVMTDPTDPSSFTEVDRFYNGGNYADFVQYTVNFSSYTGNGKYIAFRNVATNSDAVSSNFIDDITLSVASTRNESAHNNAFNANGENGYNDIDEITAPLGVDEFDLADFNVWPNPTTGLLTLAAEAQRVEIVSLMGQRVAVFENTSSVNISDLPAGVYILKAILPQGEAVRKIVKR